MQKVMEHEQNEGEAKMQLGPGILIPIKGRREGRCPIA